MTVHYTTHDTPIGPLLLAADDSGLRRLDLPNRHSTIDSDWIGDAAPLKGTLEQIDAYFAGELQQFDVGLAPRGTHFQLGVWRALEQVGYGETQSYGDIARAVGRPRASRAVGAANGKNPIAIIIPCHRIIGADGTLTGYGGGLPTKRRLLELERAHRG
jgi:methylated-DNA-[protein]-cysteine S-methyltransferase